MKRPLVFLFGIFLLWSGLMPCRAVAENIKHSEYENVRFSKPPSKAALDDLGLTEDQKTFDLSQIQAPVVVVEVFNTDCPHCKGEVRHINELYDLIQQKGLADKVKLIGIGVRDSDSELSVYQKKYGVKYPLIADPDSQIYYIVGSAPIPCLFVMLRDAQGYMKKVYTKSRESRNGSAILDSILKVIKFN